MINMPQGDNKKVSLSSLERGLYIHVPFCVHKCRYCDFVSYCGRNEIYDSYIEALIAEMKEYRGSRVDTVFIGGGTPTALNSFQLDKLCKAINDNFNISSECEFTSEANPGTLDYEKVRALLDNGVNRISLGVQSFNDCELREIGRIHDAQTAYNTVELLNKYGFDNISIDLMTALPNQSMESLMNSLKIAVQLPLKHISAYSLIIEDGTPIAEACERGEINLPNDDEDRDMYAAAKHFLKENGFYQYEISNYAKPGYESRHNIKYWQCKEYFGIGAAAHSYVDGVRFSNTAVLEDYIKGNYRSGEKEILMPDDKIFEFIIMGMRMNIGINMNEFKNRFGISIQDKYGELLNKFESGGFIEIIGEYIRFTDRGRDVSNSILCEFA